MKSSFEKEKLYFNIYFILKGFIKKAFLMLHMNYQPYKYTTIAKICLLRYMLYFITKIIKNKCAKKFRT